MVKLENSPCYMKSKEKYKPLTVKDIDAVRAKASEAASAAVDFQYVPGCFEPKALEEADQSVADMLKQAIKEKQRLYQENAELCIICDMALLYLKEHTKEN